MRAVRFTRQYGVYNGGEIAGFDEPEASALVASGAAEFLDPGAAQPESTQAPAAPEHAVQPRPRRPRQPR